MPAERAEGVSLCRGCGSSSRLPRLLLLLSASRPPAPDWTLLLRLCEDKKADIGGREGGEERKTLQDEVSMICTFACRWFCLHMTL